MSTGSPWTVTFVLLVPKYFVWRLQTLLPECFLPTSSAVASNKFHKAFVRQHFRAYLEALMSPPLSLYWHQSVFVFPRWLPADWSSSSSQHQLPLEWRATRICRIFFFEEFIICRIILGSTLTPGWFSLRWRFLHVHRLMGPVWSYHGQINENVGLYDFFFFSYWHWIVLRFSSHLEVITQKKNLA